MRASSIVLALLLSSSPLAQNSRVPVVGLPCDGCDGVFDNMPATLTSTGRIAPAGEPGEPMRIEGIVRDRGGRPAAGIIVYAYQTNAKGVYPPDTRAAGAAGQRHGLLRGWAKTDAAGRYRFDTIRPAGYPNSTIEQHVHMHVIEPGRFTYYIDEMVFTDDPRLTPEARRNVGEGRGGSGVVTPKRDAGGTWLVTRDIVLGEKIPGYTRGQKSEVKSQK